jgi:hypothetical protein
VARLPRARILPPPLLLLNLAAGANHQQALYALAELDVANALKAGPRGVEALAAAAGVDADALHRLLKAASSKGVFREAAPRVWANNRVSALLRADRPFTMRPMVRHWGGESYAPHHHVLEAIKIGSPHANAFEA